MKTLEFKLDLNKRQQETIDKWLDELRWVWNEGLSLLEEEQQRYWREKGCKASEYPSIDDGNVTWKIQSNPIFRIGGIAYTATALESAYQSGKLERPKKEIKPSEFVSGLCCPFKFDREKRELTNQAATRKHYEREPDSRGRLFSSAYYRSEFTPHLTVPSKYRTAVWQDLGKAWSNYLDPKHKARKPQYKRKGDSLTSLSNGNAGGVERSLNPIEIIKDGKFGNGRVKFPGLGEFRVKGLFRRYNFQSEQVFTDKKGNLLETPKLRGNWGESRIVKEASAYYLQVVVPEVMQLDPPKHPDDAVGLDPGVVNAINRSDGWVMPNHRHIYQVERRIARLQRKRSRQKDGSQNQKKTATRIAKLHAKVKRRRRAANHKVSTALVQTFGGIAIEENRFSNMTRKPKPKKSQNGDGYEKNQASAKAGLNKALLDVGGYQLRSMIEGKSKQHCEFHAVNAPHNSQTCPECGTIDKDSRVSQSEFICTSCGFTTNADINAAEIAARKAEWTKPFNIRVIRGVKLQSKGTQVSKGNRRSRKADPTKPAFVRPDGEHQQELASVESGSKPHCAEAGTPEITGESHPARGLFEAQLRESGEVFLQEALKPPQPLPSNGSRRKRKRCTRATDATQLSINFDDAGDRLTG